MLAAETITTAQLLTGLGVLVSVIGICAVLVGNSNRNTRGEMKAGLVEVKTTIAAENKAIRDDLKAHMGNEEQDRRDLRETVSELATDVAHIAGTLGIARHQDGTISRFDRGR